MFDDLLEQATVLRGQRKPFTLATVVACKPPTSAKPGAKAIVQADGSFYGWVGGSCAQPLVTQEALKALEDGRTRLLFLAPDPRVDLQLEGIVAIPMVCQSEGTLAIYLEPFLPRPQFLVVGQSPMARSLAMLGKALGFYVCACDPAATKVQFPDAEVLIKDLEGMKGWIGPGSYVVVATMGHYDEEALMAVVGSEARYIGLVASPKRGKAVIDYLRGKGVPDEMLQKVKYPAGLDIGAVTPEEIALTILTEIVQRMRAEGELVPLATSPVKGEGMSSSPSTALRTGSAKDGGGVPLTVGPGLESAPTPTRGEEVAADPICGMTVNLAEARYISTRNGETFYFCCLRCKETFDRKPEEACPPDPPNRPLPSVQFLR